MDQIRGSEINLPRYYQLIFEKGARAIQWRKDSVHSKWCGATGICTYQRKQM
jgi:hypothetical protein